MTQPTNCPECGQAAREFPYNIANPFCRPACRTADARRAPFTPYPIPADYIPEAYRRRPEAWERIKAEMAARRAA